MLANEYYGWHISRLIWRKFDGKLHRERMWSYAIYFKKYGWLPGSLSQRIESVFQPNLDILVAFTNLSGSAQDLTVTFDFYENGI